MTTALIAAQLLAFPGRLLFMLGRSYIAVALAAAYSLAMPLDRANAQGFFEQLFGNSTPPAPVRFVPLGQARGSSQAPRAGDTDSGDDRIEKSGGTYRTVCVRTCDGSFFPISFATTRKNFPVDQAKCTASCSDARLFAYRNSASGIEDASDMTGRAYTALPMAFVFKKKVVEGCTCRPPPWSEAELQRHKAYADAGEAKHVAATLTTDTKKRGTQGLAAIVQPSNQSAEQKIVTSDATPPDAIASKAPPTPTSATAAAKTISAKRISFAAAAAKPRGNHASPSGVAMTMAYGVPKKSASGLALPAMGLGGQSKFKWPGD
ncbi:MAG: DUF2865 domain-containing protein [Hyphomicrobiaceae bacterium]